jgi:hypothetical protein
VFSGSSDSEKRYARATVWLDPAMSCTDAKAGKECKSGYTNLNRRGTLLPDDEVHQATRDRYLRHVPPLQQCTDLWLGFRCCH